MSLLNKMDRSLDTRIVYCTMQILHELAGDGIIFNDDEFEDMYETMNEDKMEEILEYFSTNQPPSYEVLGMMVSEISRQCYGDPLLSDEDWKEVLFQLHANCGLVC